MKILDIQLGPGYSIYVDHNLFQIDYFYNFCQKINQRLVMITDSNLVDTHGKPILARLHQQHISCDLLSFPAGEIHKTRETKQMLEDQLLMRGYGRDTCLIALGGGVVSDLVGFIAATYARGINVIYLPTTLLAMVDACIGGKTGVNTPYGKNLIGCYYQPHAVFIDTATLTTLPNHEWYNGVVEIIKHSLIADTDFFNELHQNAAQFHQHDATTLLEMIYKSCIIKKNIVEQDEYDHGIRHLLNFGHTIGHMIETIENYRIGHGEAVAIGILVESYLSILSGYLSANVLTTIENILRAYRIPLKTSVFHQPDHFHDILALDKKSVAKIPHFVLLDDIGHPHHHLNAFSMPVTPAHLEQALQWAKAKFNS